MRFAVLAPPPFEAPLDLYEIPAGGPTAFVPITLRAAQPGPIQAELRVVSNDPDRPEAVVLLTAQAVAACPADVDGDGTLTLFDFLAFQSLFDAGDLRADFDGDGTLTVLDFLAFQNAFDAGC
ncbi:MAG: hypothetical protein KatS3mg103_0262 [Phycisphaerales bacterium]|nr:MAG: hypothetical protein KatS3mg103_0262 [Phycisphaerales bacterium]